MVPFSYDKKELYSPGIPCYYGFVFNSLHGIKEEITKKVVGVKFQKVYYYETSRVYWIPELDILISAEQVI